MSKDDISSFHQEDLKKPGYIATFKAKSDIGLCRKENQDNFAIIENPYFKIFIVADGMGGVKGGAVASRIAIETLKNFFKFKTDLTVDVIKEGIESANRDIFKVAAKDLTLLGMGTTLTLLAIKNSKLFVANVGDSRVYKLNSSSFEQLTEDHTFLSEALKNGIDTAPFLDKGSFSHVLTRSLGSYAEVIVDCWETNLDIQNEGCKFLLCSDGLYGGVPNTEICSILSVYDPERASDLLIEKANLAGGYDNTTVICISVFNSKVTENETIHFAPINSETEYPQRVTPENLEQIIAKQNFAYSSNPSKEGYLKPYSFLTSLHPREAFLTFFVFSGMIFVWIMFLRRY